MRASLQTLTALSLFAAVIGCGSADAGPFRHPEGFRFTPRGPVAPRFERVSGLRPVPFHFCRAPAVLESECVAYGPTPPGMLFGACLRTELVCQTPANIQ